jgi:hypothetical protein
LLPDDQVHPDTHVLTMVNNVIGVVNYVIAARPSLLNFVIADTVGFQWGLLRSADLWGFCGPRGAYATATRATTNLASRFWGWRAMAVAMTYR